MATENKQYPLQRALAEIRAIKDDVIEVVFTTGQSGLRYDYWTDEVYHEKLEVSDKALRSERLDKGLSLIDNHNRYSGIDRVFGVTDSWRIENGKLIGTVKFSKRHADIEQDVKDGILRHFSLGYRVYEWEIERKRNENGEMVETRTAVDWEATELSIVPVSFETENGVVGRAQRSADDATFAVKMNFKPEGKTMTDNVNTQERGASEKPVPQAKPQPIVKQEPERAIDPAAIASDTRSALPEFLSAVRAAGLPDDDAIEAYMRGDNVESFRKAVLDKLAEQRSADKVQTFGAPLKSDNRQDEADYAKRGIEAVLKVRVGQEVDAKERELAAEYRGMRTLDLARELLAAKGVRTKGLSSMEVASRALHTTSDFPLLLENVMHKSLMKGFEETPRTFLTLGQRATLSDFREKHALRLGDAPDLKKLNEHGEYEAGTISESGEKYRLHTYARKIGFTRVALINDDLDALGKIPRMFGAAGARKESDIVWGMLLGYDFENGAASPTVMSDGKELFHSAHGNLYAHTDAKLSAGALNKMRELGRLQKTIDGKRMNVSFTDLVVPAELEGLAEQLIMPSWYATSADAASPRLGLNLIVEPRLSDVSSKAWYMFAKGLDTFEYAYLEGEQELYTEVNTSTDIDGLEIKVRKDFGAGMIDWRGVAKSKGEA